jgi:DNA invertase Pin-like site-specific DNA recombinase
MLVGYARTSTVDQQAGFEAQLRDLGALGCEEIFQEQVSSVAERKELERGLQFIRKGDVLIVTKLDRLARSMKHLLEIVDTIKRKGASLRILDMGLDTNSSTSELIMHMLGAVAQWERTRMLERQKEGIAKAKAEGKFKGRKPTARLKSERIIELKNKGVRAAEIAHRLGIGRASVYRVLGEKTVA